VIVIEPGLPVIVVENTRAYVEKPPPASVARLVYVWPPPEGVPVDVAVSHVVARMITTSPLEGVKLGVTSADVSPVCGDSTK
jgi:hypothetical protein